MDYQTEFTTFFGYLVSLAQLMWGALRLDPEAFHAMMASSKKGVLGISVLGLGWFSESLGQSFVLFINRVRPRNFVASIFLTTWIHIASVILWLGLSWIIYNTFFGKSVHLFREAAPVVSLAFAPLVFGFLAVIPYLGSFVQHAVRVWVLLAITVGFAALAQSFWLAVVSAVAGFVALMTLIRFLPAPLKAVNRWVLKKSTGVEAMMGRTQLIQKLMEQSQREREKS